MNLIDFIMAHPWIIGAAAAILFSFIEFIINLLVFKNKKVNFLELVIEKLPSFINEAESISSDGKFKKEYCLSLALKYLSLLTGKKCEALDKKYSIVISNCIENILSTPQKKGNLKDEKKAESCEG